MNWLKIAKNIENFEDRNRVNHAIHWLESSINTVRYLSELVFMTNRGAMKMASELISNKSMSSYPIVIELLEEANRVALDNPRKFADICRQAADRLEAIKEDLVEQRERFGNKDAPNDLKGWVIDE